MRLRLFGREALPAHLSARLPAARYTQICTCMWVGDAHTRISTHKQADNVREDRFTKSQSFD